MDDKVTMYRKINDGQDGTSPKYERWFPKTRVDAVIVEESEEQTEEGTVIKEVTLDQKLDALNIQSTPKTAIVKFVSGLWGDTEPYIQTVDVEGLKETDVCVIGIYYNEDAVITQDEVENIKMNTDRIFRFDSLDGQLKATCLGQKPDINLWFQIKW